VKQSKLCKSHYLRRAPARACQRRRQNRPRGGALSQWLSKGIEEAGFDVVLMETRLVKAALKAMPIKTDRRDAQGIARLLQMGWYRLVHRKSVSSQEIRALLTARKSVQQVIINLELSMRGVLRNFGLKLGHVTRIRYEARVRELVEQNEILSASTEALLRARAQLRAELAELDATIADLQNKTTFAV
jgi:transposase